MENKTFVIVGTQWGDEGKGKIIDVLSPKADYIVRFRYYKFNGKMCYWSRSSCRH